MKATPPFVVAPDGEIIRVLTGRLCRMEVSGSDGRRALFCQGGSGDPDRDRAVREEGALYHIRQVIEPDEYHETVDDNADTNAMAQWNLEGAERTARLLAERWPAEWRALSRRLGLDAEAPRGWLRVARDLYTGFNKQTGLFEQFQGYFELEEIELAAFAHGLHRLMYSLAASAFGSQR